MSFNYVPSSLPAPGTTGNVLTSNGTAWTSAAASSGAMTLIQTITASGQSSVEFTSIGNYNSYVMVIKQMLWDRGASGWTAYLNQGTGATPTWRTSGYAYNYWSSTAYTPGTTPTWSASLSGDGNIGLSQGAGGLLSGVINITGINSTRFLAWGQFSGTQQSGGAIGYINIFTLAQNTSYTTTAFRFYDGSIGETFTGGSVSLYGISS